LLQDLGLRAREQEGSFRVHEKEKSHLAFREKEKSNCSAVQREKKKVAGRVVFLRKKKKKRESMP